MQNVTPMLAGKKERERDEQPSGWLPGGVAGFVAWWIALTIPFLLYGSNTLFFFLYTWPFFLALLPVSVLLGVVTIVLLRGRIVLTTIVATLLAVLMFWLLFSWLTGW